MTQPPPILPTGRLGGRSWDMNELQSNLWKHLLGTLEDLSSDERQRQYKIAVPFVRVPAELLEQWAGHVRCLRENVGGLDELFTESQRAAMLDFEGCVAAYLRGEAHLLDVPDILSTAGWVALMRSARALCSLLPNR